MVYVNKVTYQQVNIVILKIKYHENGINSRKGDENAMLVKAKKELIILIAEKGYSAEELSKKIGVSRLTVYSVIKRKPIRTSTAKKFCVFFEVSMMEYFDLVLEEE